MTKILFYIITVFISFHYSLSTKFNFGKGCSAPPLTADNKPFVIVWNHPTFKCEQKGFHLNFEQWGIINNSNDTFIGSKIVLFYRLGKWPYYDEKGKPVNGGLPQLSNLTDHLVEVDEDLKASIGLKSFTGLGVIDFEHWRPIYQMNFYSKSIYKEKSLKLAEKKYPHYNQSQLLEEAMKEFNDAAKQFFYQTLLKVKTYRPGGKWGYYLFPRCFDPSCDGTTYDYNNRINWLFETSSSLYPSIYFNMKTPSAVRALKIKHTLGEAFRVKAKFSEQDIPIMPYSKTQDGPYDLYKKDDLSLAIQQPADMGASGVVLWGSSADALAKNECTILQSYINDVLGPFSQELNYFFGNCSDILCNGNGRCVRVDYERRYQQHLRESGRSECLISEQELSGAKKSCKNCYKSRSINLKNKIKRGLDLNFKSWNSAEILIDKILGGKSSIKNTLQFKSESKGKFLSFTKNNFMKMIKQHMFSPSRLKENYYSSVTINPGNFDKEETVNIDAKPIPKPNSVNDNVNNLYNSAQRAGNLKYDFDDYYCKCYPGHSGKSCENGPD